MGQDLQEREAELRQLIRAARGTNSPGHLPALRGNCPGTGDGNTMYVSEVRKGQSGPALRTRKTQDDAFAHI